MVSHRGFVFDNIAVSRNRGEKEEFNPVTRLLVAHLLKFERNIVVKVLMTVLLSGKVNILKKGPAETLIFRFSTQG